MFKTSNPHLIHPSTPLDPLTEKQVDPKLILKNLEV